MATPIYLDHAAATPLDEGILKQMLPYLTEQFYNPSATYLAAKKVRHAIDDARSRTAKVLDVRPGEIIFTAGATEANNLAIHGVMAKHPNGKVLVSAVEHDSVLQAAKQYNCQIIPVDTFGHVDVESLTKMLSDDVVLVSCMWINNEVGTIAYMGLIRQAVLAAREARIMRGNFTPLYLHTDGAQAPNLIHLLPKRQGIDLLSLNGGKIYGPKQSGALYVAAGVDLEPLLYGGGQERGLRSGTENVANIVGFSLALEKASSRRNGEEKRPQKLQKLFRELLVNLEPKVTVTLPVAEAYNFVHIMVQGADNERLMMELDEAGIQCAVGSACSASDDEPSHVLKAMGFSDQQAQSSLRFTMGRQTSEADVRKTVTVLAKLV